MTLERSHPNQVRVVIADSRSHFIDLATTLLEMNPQIEVVGRFTSGLRAVALTPKLDADLVFVDLELPDLNGFETSRRLKESGCKARVVILTLLEAEWSAEILKLSGADAFLSKSRFVEELPQILAGFEGQGN